MTRSLPPWSRRVWAVLAFAAAPMWPPLAYAILAPLGAARVVRTRRIDRFAAALLVFCSVGAAAHLAATTQPDPARTAPRLPPAAVPSAAADGTNLVPAGLGPSLRGHAYGRFVVAYGSHRGDGFWTVPRYEPLTDAEVDRIAAGTRVPLRGGEPYTLSFLARGEMPADGFEIAFRTDDGVTFAAPRAERYPGGLTRVHATWTPPEDTELVHAFEITRLSGAWRTATIGFVQLERGAEPTAYRPPLDRVASSRSTALVGVAGWLGTGLLSVLVLSGIVAALAAVSAPLASGALLGGLTVQLVASQLLVAGERGVGLAGHPNVLGHGAVLAGLAAWSIGPRRLAWPALLVAGVLAAASGSRSAFLAWTAVAAWAVGTTLLPRASWRLVLVGAAALTLVAASLVAFGPERLRGSLDLDDANVIRRVALWRVAVDAARERPWMGVGHGGFGDYLAWHRPVGSPVPRAGHAHNLVLHLAAEGGLVVVAAFVAAAASIVTILVRWRAWTALVGVAVAMALNQLDATLVSGFVTLPLLLLLANAGPRAPDGSDRFRSPRAPATGPPPRAR